MTWPNALTPCYAGSDPHADADGPVPLMGNGQAITRALVERALTTRTPRSSYLLSPATQRWVRQHVYGDRTTLPVTLADLARTMGIPQPAAV